MSWLNSNLPPGVTDAMIEEQAGGDDEPILMSLEQVRAAQERYMSRPGLMPGEALESAAQSLSEVPDLCATVEALYGALAESQKGLQWAAKRLGAVSAITAVLDAPMAHSAGLLAQLERKE